MPIRKHEYYEGAALHQLVRSGGVETLRYVSPFFVVNDTVWLYLKHSTKGRSPWQFTFTASEQRLLEAQSHLGSVIVGLVCGPDGIAALPYKWYRAVASPTTGAVSLSCRRRYNEHYAISGPEGELDRKIAPSMWREVCDYGVER